jgi:tRNA (guanine-N7-)-methyltransferase
LEWTTVFGNTRAVEIEVGCGKGLFLVNAAAAWPEHNFFAIEVSGKYARFAADRVARRGLGNVRVAQADARRLLREWVPANSVTVIHAYFPDPWWKRRHKKRRVFTPEFTGELARILVPHGAVHIATDVSEYYEVIRSLFDGHPDFTPHVTAPPHDPAHDLDYLSNFERKYRKSGRAIFRLSYERSGGILKEI